jgi:UrcA family protein
MRTFLLVAAMIGSPLAASPDLAPTTGTTTRSVQIADLDLRTPAGQRELRGRIGHAITFVGGEYPVAAQPEEIDRLNACRKAATVDARRQLASRQGYSVYASAAR